MTVSGDQKGSRDRKLGFAGPVTNRAKVGQVALVLYAKHMANRDNSKIIRRETHFIPTMYNIGDCIVVIKLLPKTYIKI